MLVKQRVIIQLMVLIGSFVGACGIVAAANAVPASLSPTEVDWHNELAQARRNGDAAAQANALIKLADHYFSQLEEIKAVALFDEIEHAAARIDSPRAFVDVYRYLGQMAMRVRQFVKAEDYFTVAVEAIRKFDDEPLLADALNELGIADARSGNLTLAIQAFSESARLAQKMADNDLRLTALTNLSKAKVDAKDSNDLVGVLTQTVALNESSTDSDEKIERYLALGTYYQAGYRQLKMPTQWRRFSLQQFEAAKQLAIKLNNGRLQAYALAYLGQLYADEGRYDEAQELTSHAIMTAQASSAHESVYRFQLQSARLYRQKKLWQKSLDAYALARVTVKSQQQQIFAADPNAYDEVVRPLYAESIDLMVYLAGQFTSQKNSYLQQAVQTVEELRLIEFNAFYENTLLAVEQTEHQLPTNTVLLYTMTFPDRTDIFYVAAGIVHHHALNINSRLIEKHASNYFQSLAGVDTGQDFKVLSAQWFNWLVYPAQSFLQDRQIETIIFMPDAALLTLPFHTLLDGKTYLVERYNVLMAKSLSLTRFSHKSVVKKNIAAVGLGADSTSVFGEGAQRHTLEFRHDFANNPAGVDVLHVALPLQIGTGFRDIHVNFSDAKAASSWPVFDGKSRAEVLVLANIEWVTAMPEMTGLYFMPQAIGVESIVARLWSIDTASDAEFMRKFYEYFLQHGLSARDAIQRAQRFLISLGKPARLWAAYVFVEG